MKVLLTGSTGFIGKHILKKLVDNIGYDNIIVLTSRKSDSAGFLTYQSYNDYGLNKDCFNGITHIIHAGAFTPKDNHQANDMRKCLGNIEYINELLSYDFKNLKKIIHLSTLDVYENTQEIISEKSRINPISLYGSSKLYSEMVVKTYAEQNKIDYINLRIGHVYGPGEEKYKKVLPLALKNIVESKPLEIWGDGSDLRSFIYIDDVVKTIINALNTNTQIKDINVVSSTPISIRQLLETIISISGKKIEIIQRESNHIKRDLVFDNKLLLNTLLNKETDLIDGLKYEYNYLKNFYEHNL